MLKSNVVQQRYSAPVRSTVSMKLPTVKETAKVLTGSVLSVLLSGAGMDLAHSQNPSLPPYVQSAQADVRAQQKTTYFRFAPKFNEGKEYYATTLKNAVEKEDYAAVAKFFEEFVTKVNKEDSSIVKTDTLINKNIIRPMTVLSGSFAERGTSPKTSALLEQETAFVDAMKSLEGCTKDMKGEGFFAPTIKMPTGKERTKQAKAAFDAGKQAINKYIEIFNDGLMLELNKLTPI